MSDVPHEGTERPARATRAQIEDRLVRELAARLSVPVEQVDPTRELATYGLPRWTWWGWSASLRR